MVRQNRIMERSLSWKMPSFPSPDPDALDAAWRDWAVHEGIKRYVVLVSLLVFFSHIYWHKGLFTWSIAMTHPIAYSLAFQLHFPRRRWSLRCHARKFYGRLSRRLLGHSSFSQSHHTAMSLDKYSEFPCYMVWLLWVWKVVPWTLRNLSKT